MKSPDLYISHILDAVERIRRYVANTTYQEFIDDQMLQDAVAMNLEVIGEASKKLPESLTKQINLPWLEIAAMRNKIVHDYFDLDLEIIWRTATEDIVEVENALKTYLETQGS